MGAVGRATIQSVPTTIAILPAQTRMDTEVNINRPFEKDSYEVMLRDTDSMDTTVDEITAEGFPGN